MLESEKERDKFHKEVVFIEVHLQGKRVHTHDDTGDGHDMDAEVDEWDLRDSSSDKEDETNTKIVDLVQHALDEAKNC